MNSGSPFVPSLATIPETDNESSAVAEVGLVAGADVGIAAVAAKPTLLADDFLTVDQWTDAWGMTFYENKGV